MNLIDKYFPYWRDTYDNPEKFISDLRKAIIFFVETHERDYEEDEFISDCYGTLLRDYSYPNEVISDCRGCDVHDCCDECPFYIYNINSIDDTIKNFWDSKNKRLKTIRGNLIN